jgi:dissimilatory sulfite reductase (desulfoviridin) alpha/beta subunit
MRLTDMDDVEQIFRLVQSIPSKKAEHFKIWLAKVGSERFDENIDSEFSTERAIQSYRRLGYSENWINKRVKSKDHFHEVTKMVEIGKGKRIKK